MLKRTQKLSEVVRSAIESCGKSRYRISLETGIAQSVLSRFLSGERGLSLEALDVLLPYLEIEVSTRAKRRR
jgi:transcriptional regulator with XRE-family HTH domain